MSEQIAHQLLEAGVHFGHQTRKWNPKMKKFIFGSKNGVYIINLEKTIKHLETATDFLRKTVTKGGTVLFVGTKPQAQDIIRECAEKCGMYYVNHRWLGGLLTNFKTIKKAVARLIELDEMSKDGTFDKLSKKEVAMLKKEIFKLDKNLCGVRLMDKLPDAMIVVDAKREDIAVREANRLAIPVVAIADTDADPDAITFPVPGNDDAIRSIRTILGKLSEAILEGNAGRAKNPPAPANKTQNFKKELPSKDKHKEQASITVAVDEKSS